MGKYPLPKAIAAVVLAGLYLLGLFLIPDLRVRLYFVLLGLLVWGIWRWLAGSAKFHGLSLLKGNSPLEGGEGYQLFARHFQGVAYQATLQPLEPLMLWGQVEELTGYSMEDFLEGRVRFLDLIHPEDRPLVEYEVGLAIQNPGYANSVTVRLEGKEGNTRWINLTANRVTDALGRVLVQGVMLDVSEQKQAEEALEKSERQLRQITDAVQDVVLLIDEKAIIRYVTPSSTVVIGLRPQDLVGRSAYEILDPEQSRIFEQMAVASTPEQHFIQAGFAYPHPDGRTLVMEAAINFLFSQEGVFHGAVAGIRDVTTRHQAEQAVRQSEQQLRQITDAMQDIVILTDNNAIIRYITPSVEKVVGVPPERIIGLSAYAILDPEQSRGFQELSTAATPQHSATQVGFTYINPSGQTFVMEASINFLFDSEGNDQGAVAGIRDVTARHQAEQAVRQSEQMLRQVTDAMQDVVAFADARGVVRYVTPSVEGVLGYTPAEVLEHSVFEFIVPEDLELVNKAIQQALQRGASYRLEYRYKHKTGRTVWIETTVDFVYDQGQLVGSVIGGRDVTQRREAEEALREREFRLSQITNTMQDVVLLLDIEGKIQYVTPSAQAIFGYTQDELIGKSAWLLTKPEDSAELERQGRIALTRRRSYKMEYHGIHKAGHQVWVESIINFVWDEDKPTGVVIGIRDITERKQQEAYVEYMAFHDELTKLPNRRSLRQYAEETILGAKSHSTGLSLLYLDLDNFKMVNDTLGHDVGDELLVEIAQILTRQLRPGDVLARLGGDEFACILAATSREQAREVASSMAKAIRKTFTLAQQSIHLGVSIGIACFPDDGDNFVDLLKVADIAMYQAKDSGGLVVAYDPSKSPYTEERLALEAHLREAIEQQSFGLRYQPIWHLHQERLEGAEALMYWDHRSVRVPASQFIPLAEEIRQIERIDRVALRKGLYQLKQWQAQGLKLCMSINFSTQSLAHQGVIGEIQALIEEARVDVRDLRLEVTESALLRNPESAREILTQLKALGIKIAIDDFGSGYASLAYLRQLPVDRIKIDRSFVSQLGADKRDEKLVRAAIDLAHSLDAEVLAEGVETLEQLLWLREQGCDLVQGFLVGQPAPIGEWLPIEFLSANLKNLLSKPARPLGS